MNRKATLKTIALASLLSLGFASCSVYSERDRLQQQNDSLIIAQTLLETEINGYFETLNDISDNLDKVKQIGGIISQPQTEGVDQDPTVTINNSINTLSQIISDNNQKIAQLSKKLKNSNYKISQLDKALEKLSAENRRLTAELANYSTELANRDQTIAAQSLSIAALNDSAAALAALISSANEELDSKTEQLYTAWYVFGTTRELRAQGIIAKSGVASRSLLKGDFNKEYFVKIDTREVTEIPLYSKRAKVLTTHPSDSYVLEKQDGLYTLRISDATDFWSVSNYLVIDID